MAVVKYDVSNVESGGGGEQPQPGLYAGTIQSITPRKEKANGDPVRDLEVVVSVGEEYANLWTYVKTPDDANYNEAAHGWKMRELTDALKLPAKGQMDTAKQIGKKVNVKIVADTNLEGEYRGRVRSLFAPGKIEEDGEGLPAGGGDEEPLTAEELAEWSPEDLKEELTASGITLTGRFSKDKAIAALLEAQDTEAVSEEAEDDAETEPEAEAEGNGVVAGLDAELLEDLRTDAAFYSDWSEEDIKAYAEDLGIAGNVSGRKNKAKYIAAIVSLAEAAQPHMNGAGEGSGEADDDYDEWDVTELTEEIATRNEQDAGIDIKGRKTKEKLIAALREDDKVAEPF
jgi:hypothetical protein